ncbi:hypothetical protein DPEC_G00279930 [Dallia pectoralis]|uniref:Uncharacterized protein n=1 Tax=Dallia pectoralis TaxID=75939 RepID=A0ACC2FM84_DALPE|nr:hypothetical protein DPEC_G00279930 [Dallia pectoralis]
MHWEARRRQDMADRRTSRAKQQMAEEPPEPSPKPLAEADPPTPQPDGNKCSNCGQNNTTSLTLYSAKIDNRYSSIQYSQQW